MRARLFSWVILIVFTVIILWLFNLQVIHGPSYRVLSNKNCIRLILQPGARGNIFDRNSELLVGSRLSYDLLIMPQSKDEVNKALRAASGSLGINYEELKKRFNSGYLAPFFPVVISRNIDKKYAIALEEMKSGLPALMIRPQPLRYYPHGALAAHVIGYLNEIDRWRLTKLEDYGYKTKDIVGYTGIEENYDYYLRENDGALSVEVDHKGGIIRILGYRAPERGKDIKLTLDISIQKISEESLGGKKGCVVIMSPHNGEIIALASSPAYSPSAFVDRSGSNIGRLIGSSDAVMMNRAISGAYPPGSIFKLVVAAAALDLKKINMSTTFVCTGDAHIGSKEFKCWDTHGAQDLIRAIAHSCNVFFYRTGILVGANELHNYAAKFGFAKATGIDLPYEVEGYLPSPVKRRLANFTGWFDGDTANFSIGQGELLVTPVQVARMVAVFANHGFLIRPYLVQAVSGRDYSLRQKKVIRLPVNSKVIDRVREGMRHAVTDPGGTANMLSGLSVSVAGKTGTAQTGRGTPHGWFAGFFPFQKPKYVICVFLERGGSGAAACAVGKEIIKRMIEEGLI